MARAAVFLDRDGVIIENRGDYVKSLAEVEFIPGALAALRALAAVDVPILIVTNQSAVGRGLVSPETLEAINAHIVEQVARAGGRIDRIYICPHRPEEGCACRKPSPGLLQQAAADWQIDLAASVVIGDALTDMFAAQAVGATPILVRTGLGATQDLAGAGLPNLRRAHDLGAAVEQVVGRLRPPGTPSPVTKTPPDGGGA